MNPLGRNIKGIFSREKFICGDCPLLGRARRENFFLTLSGFKTTTKLKVTFVNIHTSYHQLT
jgi:hypothetical protein